MKLIEISSNFQFMQNRKLYFNKKINVNHCKNVKQFTAHLGDNSLRNSLHSNLQFIKQMLTKHIH